MSAEKDDELVKVKQAEKQVKVEKLILLYLQITNTDRQLLTAENSSAVTIHGSMYIHQLKIL